MALRLAERGEGTNPKFFGIENPSQPLMVRAIKTFPVLPDHWDADFSYRHFLFPRSDRDRYIAASESAGVAPFVCATYKFDETEDNFLRTAIIRENPVFLDPARGQELVQLQLRLLGEGAKPDRVRLLGERQQAFEGMQAEFLEWFAEAGYSVREARFYLGETDSSVKFSIAPHFMGIYGPDNILRWEANPPTGVDETMIRRWFDHLKTGPKK